MKILAVTAHPDDLEIACAGTLKRFQDAGAEIISVVTVKPSAEVHTNRNQHIVDQELQKLNAQAAVLQTARMAYAEALKEALPKH
jgi:LmbE family N-acetylglucosaminyl deacetylase